MHRRRIQLFGLLCRTTGQRGRINIGAFGNTKYASKSGTPTANDNQAPVINPIQNATVEIGKSLTNTVSASDINGDSLTYSASGFPEGAVFTVDQAFSAGLRLPDRKGL